MIPVSCLGICNLCPQQQGTMVERTIYGWRAALVQSVEQLVGEQMNESERGAKTLYSTSFNPNWVLQLHVVSNTSSGSQGH